jgi:DNA (cytosine-5)-methyltransferase 1
MIQQTSVLMIEQRDWRVIDLFSGCGGLSLGMEQAGFKLVAAFDSWDIAIKSYRQNFSHEAHTVDLAALGARSHLEQYQANIIVGGPPCQDFSSCGLRDETRGNANLTLVFANLVTTLKPHFFIMENVARFARTTTYQQARAMFKKAGYGLSEKILNANDSGVPQNRYRFFWIGECGGEDNAVAPYLNAPKRDRPLTVRDYFRHHSLPLEIEHYYRHPRSYRRRAIFSIDEPSPTIRGANRPIPLAALTVNKTTPK